MRNMLGHAIIATIKKKMASMVSIDEIEAGDFEFEYASVELGESNKFVAKGKNTPREPNNDNSKALDQQEDVLQE